MKVLCQRQRTQSSIPSVFIRPREVEITSSCQYTLRHGHSSFCEDCSNYGKYSLCFWLDRRRRRLTRVGSWHFVTWYKYVYNLSLRSSLRCWKLRGGGYAELDLYVVRLTARYAMTLKVERKRIYEARLVCCAADCKVRHDAGRLDDSVQELKMDNILLRTLHSATERNKLFLWLILLPDIIGEDGSGRIYWERDWYSGCTDWRKRQHFSKHYESFGVSFLYAHCLSWNS